MGPAGAHPLGVKIEITLEEKHKADKIKRQERTALKAQQLAEEQTGACQYHRSCKWTNEVLEAPVYYPSIEEFQDPLAYIRSIQGEAAQYGICKIVPPLLPAVPGGMVLNQCMVPGASCLFKFTARTQELKTVLWQSWNDGDFIENTRKYTIGQYEAMANEYIKRKFGTTGVLPPRMVEVEYWRQREMPPVNGKYDWVDYGNDVEGSAFTDHASDPLGSTKWNLKVLPYERESLLTHLDTAIPGVSDPMLYIGMLFATFAWHVEDHYLYSINYHHLGAPKTWYGVPASDAEGFEDVLRQHVYHDAMRQSRENGCPESDVDDMAMATVLNKTTVFSPRLLMEKGVKVVRMVQYAGEYVVTFPRAYHSGFSHGFNCGEAVNFAIRDWLPYGADCIARYARLKRWPLFNHEEMLSQATMSWLQHNDKIQQNPNTPGRTMHVSTIMKGTLNVLT